MVGDAHYSINELQSVLNYSTVAPSRIVELHDVFSARRQEWERGFNMIDVVCDDYVLWIPAQPLQETGGAVAFKAEIHLSEST